MYSGMPNALACHSTAGPPRHCRNVLAVPEAQKTSNFIHGPASTMLCVTTTPFEADFARGSFQALAFKKGHSCLTKRSEAWHSSYLHIPKWRLHCGFFNLLCPYTKAARGGSWQSLGRTPLKSWVQVGFPQCDTLFHIIESPPCQQ